MKKIIENLKFIIKRNIYLIHFSHKIISFFGMNFEDEYFISSYLKKGEIIIDVGAHLGESIIGFRRFNKFIKIYSFEPNPTIFKKLSKKFNKKRNVFLYNELIMSENKLNKFYVPVIKNISMPYMGSFNKQYIIQRFEHFFFFSTKNKLKWEEYEIGAKKLDEYNLEPKILKIDTEGSELKVLQGSEKMIDKHNPLIIVEFNHNNYKKIYEFLIKKGYGLFKFVNKSFVSVKFNELLNYEKFKNQRNLIFKKNNFSI